MDNTKIEELDSRINSINKSITSIQESMNRNVEVYGIIDEEAYDEMERLIYEADELEIQRKSIVSEAAKPIDATGVYVEPDYEKKYEEFVSSLSSMNKKEIDSTIEHKKAELGEAKHALSMSSDKKNKKRLNNKIQFLKKCCHKAGETSRKRK